MLGILANTIISALVPVGADAVKKLVDKKIGPPPVPVYTVEDRLKLDEAEIKRLEVIAKLDQPGGTPSQWVIDLRASSRYLASGIVIVGGFALLAWASLEVAIATLVLEAISIVFGFLFGSRFLVPRR